MKVLLVNPPHFPDLRVKRAVRIQIPSAYPPLGLACLAGSVRAAGHEVQILDLNLHPGDPVGALIYELKTFMPQAVGFSVTTPLANTVMELTDQVKFFAPQIFTIWGGHHISGLPDRELTCTLVDAYIKGEGEIELLRVLEKLEPGIYQAAKIENLDGLPLPAFDLLKYGDYAYSKVISREQPVGFLQTSRGCRGKCSFCSRVINGAKIRLKSVHRIYAEVDALLACGVKEIHFLDDNLTVDRRRMENFCYVYQLRRYSFPWVPRNALRVDSVDLPLLKLMRVAGCYRTPFGVESGSQRVLDRVGKEIRLEQVRQAVRWAKEAGMMTDALFMMGLPGEKEVDLQKSIAFCLELDTDYFNVAPTMPYPGTQLYSQIKREGRLVSSDWSDYYYNAPPGSVYRHDMLSWSVIDKYMRKFYRRFYFRPKKVWAICREIWRRRLMWDYVKVLVGTKWV